MPQDSRPKDQEAHSERAPLLYSGVATLVDAFNLIHSVDRLKAILTSQGPHAAGRALIARVVSWLQAHPAPPNVVLVFDGTRPPGQPLKPQAPTLRLRYADHADSVLVELLDRRGHHTLVSRDGELVSCARRIGQEVMTPASWWGELCAEQRAHTELNERDRPLSGAEKAYWLEAFSDKPKGASKPHSKAPGPPADEPKLSRGEVDFWLREFGEDPSS